MHPPRGDGRSHDRGRGSHRVRDQRLRHRPARARTLTADGVRPAASIAKAATGAATLELMVAIPDQVQSALFGDDPPARGAVASQPWPPCRWIGSPARRAAQPARTTPAGVFPASKISSAVSHPAGTPALSACCNIRRASCGLVAKPPRHRCRRRGAARGRRSRPAAGRARGR